MQIDFFEEFPDEQNLSKANLLRHKCVVFIAAKSLDEFLDIKKKLYGINPLIESAYWPLLNSSYWISPFSATKELKDLYSDLKKHQLTDLKVLLDLELPFKNPRLFYIELLSFFKNKRIIKSFLKNADKLGVRIFTAEYPAPLSILRFLGISYPVRKYHHERIPMYYSSMLKKERSKNFCKRMIAKDPHIALGVTAKGILGNEPLITPEELNKDFNYFQNKNIVIFRLGGLNEKYLDIIEKYLD
jgi:hypothetical protein